MYQYLDSLCAPETDAAPQTHARNNTQRRHYERNAVPIPMLHRLPPSFVVEHSVGLAESGRAGLSERHPKEKPQGLSATTTSVCSRGSAFRSNGGLVSPNGRYTFVQHNGESLHVFSSHFITPTVYTSRIGGGFKRYKNQIYMLTNDLVRISE